MSRYAEPARAAPIRKKTAPAATPGHHQRAATMRTIQLRGALGAKAAGPVAQPVAKTLNRSGLPRSLQAGVERLSGLAMDDVRVHRNSSEPAKLGALAYTKGSDIHLGPGQERHLPHEAWHVVQQKQGRVKATTQMKGLPVNEDQNLENEADRMSANLDARFADAAAETMASGKVALAGPDRMSKSTAGSGHPMQLQKREKKPQQPANDPIGDLLRQGFSQYLEQQRLNEEINGAAAKALASAYLSAQAPQIPPTLMAAQTHITTPAQPDTPPAPPTFEEVYKAILSLMHVAGTPSGRNAGMWKWTPAPKKGGTRQDYPLEVLDWSFEEGKGYIKDEVRDKLIKEISVQAAATWRAAEGLKVVAEIALQGLKVVGWFTLAISILELLNLLKKPVEKSLSRQEQILANVTSWLTRDAQPANSTGKAKPDTSNSYPSKSYQENANPLSPVYTRVPGR